MQIAEINPSGFFRIFRNDFTNLTNDPQRASRFKSKQQAHRFFKPAVGQQLADQIGAWIEKIIFVLSSNLVVIDWWWSNRPGLDLQQRGRHQDEIASSFEIQIAIALPRSHHGDKLIGNRRHRNVDDVQFGLTHQKQQQVEGTRKRLYSDRVAQVRRGTLKRSLRYNWDHWFDHSDRLRTST